MNCMFFVLKRDKQRNTFAMTKTETYALASKTYKENANNPKRLITEFNKLLKKAHASGDFYFLGVVFRFLAVTYYILGDREKMFMNAAKSLAVSKNTNDPELLADAYTTLGVAYSCQENYQLALINYDKAYEIIKQHRIKGSTRTTILNDISKVYYLMGDYKSVIHYMTECMELFQKESPEDVHEPLVFSSNLAYMYMHIGENEKALQFLEDAKNLVEQASIKPYICIYHLKYAMVYYQLKNKRLGGKHIDTAIKLAEESPDLYLIYEDLSEIAHMLLQNGERKRTDKVIQLITEYGNRNAQTMDRLLICSTLADYYKNIGDSKRAIEQYEQALELYKTRTDELRRIQLRVNKILKDADASIKKLNKKVKENKERADKDPMTRLLNRSAMLRTGEEFIESTLKKKEKMGAIFIDIDFFKECNDTYGHARGDEVIKEVARTCQAEESENICFARYGGDEFLGLTCGLEDDAVADIARRICTKIRKADIPNKKNPNGQRVTLSVGIVNIAVTKDTETILQIANYADKAVYYSKNAGKNCIHFLDHGNKEAADKDNPFVKIEF